MYIVMTYWCTFAWLLHVYVCEWSILYEQSLFNKFLFNNCNRVCPQGPKLEVKLLSYYCNHRSSILSNWFGLQTTSKSIVHAGTHWKVHIEQLLKDRTILSRSHTKMFIFKINLKSLQTHLVYLLFIKFTFSTKYGDQLLIKSKLCLKVHIIIKLCWCNIVMLN